MSFIICAFLTFTIGCSQVQNNVSENQANSMLFEFYSKYFYLWENTPISENLPANVLYGKLDSLMIVYCTPNLRKKANEHLEFGVDLLTNNLVSIDLNENLKIQKDSTKENEYIVSFIATNSDAADKPVKQNVILHVTVIKEDESFKINSIK